jgi:hypothetical protein
VSNLQWQEFSLGLTHSLNHSFGLLGEAAILDSYISWCPWLNQAGNQQHMDRYQDSFNLSILTESLSLFLLFSTWFLLITPLLLIPCRILSITNLVEKLIAMRAFITCLLNNYPLFPTKITELLVTLAFMKFLLGRGEQTKINYLISKTKCTSNGQESCL